MEYEVQTIESIKVMGIAVRTSNVDGKAMTDIGQLWERFYTADIASKIPHKKNLNLINVYLEYEGDDMQPYTALLGYEVTKVEHVPEGLVFNEIPAGTYARFDRQGEIPAVVGDTWNAIYQMELKRTYTADFDVYPEGSENRVQVHVGILE